MTTSLEGNGLFFESMFRLNSSAMNAFNSASSVAEVAGGEEEVVVVGNMGLFLPRFNPVVIGVDADRARASLNGCKSAAETSIPLEVMSGAAESARLKQEKVKD